MATPPDFSVGAVLTAAQMNKIAWFKVSPTSVSAGSTITADGDVTFSAQTSVSLNGVFTSDYDCFRVYLYLNGSTAGSFAKLRMRAAGADATGNNYYRYGYTSAYAGALVGYNGGPENAFNIVGQWGGSLASRCVMEIDNPVAAVRTGWVANVNDVGSGESYNLNGVIDLTTSYDGFTVFPNAGTMTGTIRVYGIRN